MTKENTTEETMYKRFIDINGTKVLNLTPSFKGEMALVSRTVLDKLTENLGKVSLSTLKYDLRHKISECSTLVEIVTVAEDFANFHNSVNLIKEIKMEEELSANPPKIVHTLDEIEGENIDELH